MKILSIATLTSCALTFIGMLEALSIRQLAFASRLILSPLDFMGIEYPILLVDLLLAVPISILIIGIFVSWEAVRNIVPRKLVMMRIFGIVSILYALLILVHTVIIPSTALSAIPVLSAFTLCSVTFLRIALTNQDAEQNAAEQPASRPAVKNQ